MLGLSALILATACQPQEELTIVEETIDGHLAFETSGEEVDAMLIEEFGNAKFTWEEKMDFLSDKLVEDLRESHPAYRPDPFEDPEPYLPLVFQMTVVAQVYDADVNTYFTDVNVGPSTTTVSSRVKRQREGSFGFVGCNANVYRNGVNIEGVIDNAVNFSCSGADVKAVADADWFSTIQDASAYVYIKCDD
ncbi:MAG TPA: hypothetical protein DCE41_21050 [Cytophagales bacterium]|nr:hypothetical protein [Cytophagales bacterium]